MQYPTTADTIVAVATGWEPSPLGIVRVSGPASRRLLVNVGVEAPPPSPRPVCVAVRVRLEDDCGWPGHLVCFTAPRSYTGQDVAELHLPGCLPLLREVCARLIAGGARRALPGEFTARAFLCGRLAREQVEGVLALLNTASESAARQAARLLRGETQADRERWREEITDLLARIEAGVDFADEEDVQFVSAPEVRQRLADLLVQVEATLGQRRSERREGRAHVALVGLPNAGKSALFNALCGHARAIVSPVIGTTRDVLSCEITVGGRRIVLQDCAGLRHAPDELELAAHRATERTAELADLVLWVHAVDTPWTDNERAAYARLPAEGRLVIGSKADLGIALSPNDPPAAVLVSAQTGRGLAELQDLVARQLDTSGFSSTAGAGDVDLAPAALALKRAADAARSSGDQLEAPELIALELRAAIESLRNSAGETVDEAVLGRIFARFCIGK